MLVGRGALSFRTFQVSGKNPTPKNDRILERLETFRADGASGQLNLYHLMRRTVSTPGE